MLIDLFGAELEITEDLTQAQGLLNQMQMLDYAYLDIKDISNIIKSNPQELDSLIRIQPSLKEVGVLHPSNVAMSEEGISDVLVKIWDAIITLFKKIIGFFKMIINKIIDFFSSVKSQAQRIIDWTVSTKRATESLSAEAMDPELLAKFKNTYIEVIPARIDKESWKLKKVIESLKKGSEKIDSAVDTLKNKNSIISKEDMEQIVHFTNIEIKTLGFDKQYRVELIDNNVIVKTLSADVNIKKLRVTIYDWFNSTDILGTIKTRMEHIKEYSETQTELKHAFSATYMSLSDFIPVMESLKRNDPTRENATTFCNNVKCMINTIKMLATRRVTTLNKYINNEFQAARLVMQLYRTEKAAV